MRKSQFVGFLLTFLFGPLGLLYSNVALAIAFIIVAIILAYATMGMGAVIMWPLSIIVGFFTVGSVNKKADLEERRHQELVSVAMANNKSQHNLEN